MSFSPLNDDPRVVSLVQTIREAFARSEPLEVIGTGSRRALGRPVKAQKSLSVGALDTLVAYEPEELIVITEAGVPVSRLLETLDGANQQLAFEPFDFGLLLGQSSEMGGTVGGMIATGQAGSRRVLGGGVRDSVLGYQGIGGRGDLHRAGGRVVKNVTGFDLSRLMAGSFGTLAVMCEVVLRTVPKPHCSASLVLFDLDEHDGLSRLRLILRSVSDVSGAAFIPAKADGATMANLPRDRSMTILRVEGIEQGVRERLDRITDRFLGAGEEHRVIEGASSERLWKAINRAEPLCSLAEDGRCVWRFACPPTGGAALGYTLTTYGAHYYYDWAGGLIWAELDQDRSAVDLRAGLSACGGHATLIRAPEKARVRDDVFQPLFDSERALVERIKAAYDPSRILNPGRMFNGI